MEERAEETTGKYIAGSAKRKKIDQSPRTRMWLELDCDVYERWCAFARDLGLSPRQLAAVLLDVAMGISSLPRHGGRSASAVEMKSPPVVIKVNVDKDSREMNAAVDDDDDGDNDDDNDDDYEEVRACSPDSPSDVSFDTLKPDSLFEDSGVSSETNMVVRMVTEMKTGLKDTQADSTEDEHRGQPITPEEVDLDLKESADTDAQQTAFKANESEGGQDCDYLSEDDTPCAAKISSGNEESENQAREGQSSVCPKTVRIRLKKSAFNCPICKKHFSDPNQYNRHRGTHATRAVFKKQKSYPCDMCTKVFVNNFRLRRHLLTHKEKSLQCRHCPFRCKAERYLKNHMQSRHKDVPYDQKAGLVISDTNFRQDQGLGIENTKTGQDVARGDDRGIRQKCDETLKPKKKKAKPHLCDTCGKVMSSRACWARHQLTHSEKSLKCDRCPATFAVEEKLKRHVIKEHTKEWPFTCGECGKGFFYGYDRDYHQKLHSTDPQHCEICGKVFVGPRSYNAHMRTHGTSEPLECSICGKSFATEFKLKEHLGRHSTRNKIECPVCKKKLSSRKWLKSHMNIHTGDTPYMCHICSRTFIAWSLCRAHIRKDHPEEPHQPRQKIFKCTFCDHSTFTQRLLKKHVTVMHTEKKFACTECGKRFHFQDLLNEHMRLHTGQAFKCEVCSKEFTNGAYFKQHMNYHYGQKDHKCQECGTAFHRKCNLTAHMRIHTGEKPFQCEICHKRFGHSSNLKSHMKFHAKDKPESSAWVYPQ